MNESTTFGDHLEADGEWEVRLSSEAIEHLRGNPQFAALLTLARIINAIRFCEMAIFAAREEDTPSARRQRNNGFFFLTALLVEAFEFLRRNGSHFRGFAAFDEELVPLRRDKRFTALHSERVAVLRNKFVFHFDGDVAPAALKTLHLDQYTFLSSRGKARGQVYYDLADTIGFQYLLPGAEGGLDMEAYERLLTESRDLTLAFTGAADRLMRDILGKWPLQVTNSDEPPSA